MIASCLSRRWPAFAGAALLILAAWPAAAQQGDYGYRDSGTYPPRNEPYRQGGDAYGQAGGDTYRQDGGDAYRQGGGETYGQGRGSHAPRGDGRYGSGNDAYSQGDAYSGGGDSYPRGGDAYTPGAGQRYDRAYADPGQPADDGRYGEPYAPPGEQSYGEAAPYEEERSYNQNEIISAGHGFFGAVSQNLASAVEYAFRSQGRPNGYILGEDAGGAFVVGLRYGEGRLFTKDAGDHKVFWQGPSVGYDAGAEGSKAMVLVYNMRDPSEIYNRFGGVQGAAYIVGGLSVQFQKYGDVTLAVIRSGVGLRLGANVGYLKYTRMPTWNPL